MSNGISRGGIVTRRYKSGSIVYFEGDKSEYIYILKTGRVVLSYIKPETGEEIKEEMRPGEFFGVKSALGKYPREETAQTIGETVVLVLTLADFEQLVLGNVQVVKKMLRVFSNQLRRIGRAVREVLGETDTVNPEAELYKIGEYYYKNGRFEQALYAYKKYMGYYPDAKYAAHSMQRIKEIESGSIGMGDTFDMGETDISGATDMTDFSFDVPGDTEQANSTDMVDFDMDDGPLGVQTEMASEMDDYLEDTPVIENLDVVQSVLSSVETEFSEAKNQQVAGNYAGAIEIYNKIIAIDSEGDTAVEKKVEQAHFEIGKSYLDAGKLRDAIQAFSTMLKKYPRSPLMKNALLHIGMIYAKSGNLDKARVYYNKVAALPPRDQISDKAAQLYSQIRG